MSRLCESRRSHPSAMHERQFSSVHAAQLITAWLAVKVPEWQPDRLVELVFVQIAQAHGSSSSPSLSPRLCTPLAFFGDARFDAVLDPGGDAQVDVGVGVVVDVVADSAAALLIARPSPIVPRLICANHQYTGISSMLGNVFGSRWSVEGLRHKSAAAAPKNPAT